MLIGEYSTKFSEKNRIAIPKRIREQLVGEIILTRGYEKALLLLDKNMWSNIAKEVIDGSFISKNIRDTSRFLVGSAVEVEPDAQGRVVVPKSLSQYANFSDEVVFIGLVNWVEIWDKHLWEERMQYISDNSDQIAEELNNAQQHNG